MNTVPAPGPRRSNVVTLVLLVLAFAGPMVGAYVYFQYTKDVPPDKRQLSTANYGHFVHPPRALQVPALARLDGSALPEGWLHNKWTYVYLDALPCDEACRGSLYAMRQVRLAQGKHIARVQNLFVVRDGAAADPAALQALRTAYPDLTIVTGTAADVRAFNAQFQQADTARKVYLVDPRGQLMMFYQVQLTADFRDAQGMRKDLAKLLKWNQPLEAGR